MFEFTVTISFYWLAGHWLAGFWKIDGFWEVDAHCLP